LKTIKNISEFTWEKLLVICGSLLVLLPTNPYNMPLSYRDSGVFLYTGWRILNGEIPYKNIWDHKPPIIFYINALGVAIKSGSHWGVWLIELVSLFVAAYFGYIMVKKLLGVYPAIFGLFLWLLTLVFVLDGGNLTTEYSLPLQFIALFLICDSEKPDFPVFHWFLIGILGALAFFTKQTTIGIWVAFIIYLTIDRLKSHLFIKWLKELLLIFAGGISLSFIIFTFFLIHDSQKQFWSAAFFYNLIYSSSTSIDHNRFELIINGFNDLTRIGLFQFGMVGYIIAVYILFKKNIMVVGRPLLITGIIAMPIEWLLLTVSGRTFPHYLITILPVLALFASFSFWAIMAWANSTGATNRSRILILISTMGVFFWSAYHPYTEQLLAYKDAGNPTLIKYLKTVTSPEDFVLIWGADTDINYFAQRKSPSRFVYQYPLYDKGYVTENMVLEFLNDISIRHPKLIINMMNPSTPFYNFPIKSSEITALTYKLQSEYRYKETINGIVVYEYIDNAH
jgi:hypothetical protein